MCATEKTRSEDCDDTATDNIGIAVSSIELQDENGNTSSGSSNRTPPRQPSRPGEFKPVRPCKDIARAAAEQSELERQMPIFEDHPATGRDG